MATATNTLRIGTRRSALAKHQTHWVADQLRTHHPELNIKIVEVVTTGDRILDAALNQMADKGLFVKEIEDKLLSDEIDLAVHSMKDLPTEFPAGLKIGAVSERVDPRDVFVSRLNLNLADMPEGARIGTSSFRRQAQLLRFRPDLTIVDIRGNIDTRLKKAETDGYDGIVLAAAGLLRMGWQARIQEFLDCELMIPAVGQGALGLEIRENDAKTEELIAVLNDPETAMAVTAERIFLDAMGGGCHAPIGAYCQVHNGSVTIRGFTSEADGSGFHKAEVAGELKQATGLAHKLVDAFK